MKKLIIIFVLLSTQVFAEIIKIETGESDIKDKLAKISPKQVWQVRDPYYEAWSLSNSDTTAVVTMYKGEGWVEAISVWNNADLANCEASKYYEEDRRRRVRSITFDTEKKSIQVEKISGTIHIEIGETNVIEKLKKVGARDLWRSLEVLPLPEKNTVWGLSGTNNNFVRVWTLEGRVAAISFWTSPYENKIAELRNRRDAKSFTYNADDKTLQVEEKEAQVPEATAKPNPNITTKPTDPTQPNPK